MLAAGDECGRSQGGNNNGYCQDNVTCWLSWNLEGPAQALLAFTAGMVALRRAHPVLRRRDFFQGRPLIGSGVRDIVWLEPDGTEMSGEKWQVDHARALAVLLSGDGLTECDPTGHPVRDDHLLLLFNASAEAVTFQSPAHLGPGRLVVSTAQAADPLPDAAFDPSQPVTLEGRSLAVVRFANAAVRKR